MDARYSTAFRLAMDRRLRNGCRGFLRRSLSSAAPGVDQCGGEERNPKHQLPQASRLLGDHETDERQQRTEVPDGVDGRLRLPADADGVRALHDDHGGARAEGDRDDSPRQPPGPRVRVLVDAAQQGRAECEACHGGAEHDGERKDGGTVATRLE